MTLHSSIVRLIPLIGNSSAALSTFMFSLLFLTVFSSAEYAVFSFFIVYCAFFHSVSNSIFVLPFLNKTLISTNVSLESNILIFILYSLLFSIVTYVLFRNFYISSYQAIIVSLVFFVYSIRAYIRASFIQSGKFNVAFISDIVYLPLVFISCLYSYFSKDLTIAYLLFFACNFISLILYNKYVVLRLRLHRAMNYFFIVFKRFGFDSFKAAFGSEILITGVSFVIIYGYGPTEYAPVALALLFLRPFTLVLNSVNQSVKYSISTLKESKNVTSYKKKYLVNNYIVLWLSMTVYMVCYAFFKELHASFENMSLLIGMILLVLMSVRVYKSWCTIVLQSKREFCKLSESYSRLPVFCLFSMIALSFLHVDVVWVIFSLVIFEALVLLKMLKVMHPE